MKGGGRKTPRGRAVVQVVDLPELCIHKHTLSLHNSQRHCSSFLKGKVNNKKTKQRQFSPVRFGEKKHTRSHTHTHRAAADTHADERFDLSHTALWWFQPSEKSGLQPSLVWLRRHSRRRKRTTVRSQSQPGVLDDVDAGVGRADQVSTRRDILHLLMFRCHLRSLGFQIY